MTETSALRVTRAFYEWEVRGRGWASYPYPVSLEPVFRPFLGHNVTPGRPIDDGRRHTWLSALIERVSKQSVPTESDEEDTQEAHPEPLRSFPQYVEYRVGLPIRGVTDGIAAEGWLRSLETCEHPLSFELVGSGDLVSLELVVSTADAHHASGSLRAFFPDAVILETGESLRDRWEAVHGTTVGALDFGLAREFMVPLRPLDRLVPDPLTALLGALGDLSKDEIGVVQLLFEPTRAPWAASTRRAVVTSRGEPFFADAPELTKLANEKVSTPLYAVALRIAARGSGEESVWRTLKRLAGGLAQFGSPSHNEFAPLGVDDVENLEADLLNRFTRRSGMLLSLRELRSLVHFPTADIGIPRFFSGLERTRRAPEEARGEGIALGTNTHHGTTTAVHLDQEGRSRHTYIIGASGTGKSTLLARLILEDIEAGHGVGVLDPHGDLIDEILSRIPEDREHDVLLFDPAFSEISLGWNMLHANREVEREILASDLTAVFRRLSTSWGDQMTAVLNNAILAFLESSRGGTLLDLRTFLIDKQFLDEFLTTVTDEHLRSWWAHEFALLVGKKPQAPILTRLNTFLGSKLIRRIVTERKNQLDFRDVVESGGIFLVKLAQGAIGTENATLLGSLIVSKFHQVSIERQDLARHERRPFYLYLDEFHEVATPSMATLFSGARKYQLAVTVAHQDLYQLHAKVPDVERAVLANAYTRIIFRVDDEDARKLERGLGTFDADDLTNLDTGEAICRLGRKHNDFNLRTEMLSPIHLEEASTRRARIYQLAQEKYRRGSDEPPAAATPTPPVSPPVEPEAPRAPEPPPPRPTPTTTPGRGGAEHTYLQELIKRWGEERGFRATIEREVEGGGRVDVALERNDVSVACEVAITTGSEHELGNIRKCLAAGFDHVVVVSTRKRFLKELGARVASDLSESEQKRVHLFTPEECFSFLDTSVPEETAPETIAGYKVNVSYRTPDRVEDQARRRAVAGVIRKSLARLTKKR